MTFTEQELTLIRLWVMLDWPGGVDSIVTGQPVKPSMIGATIERPYNGRPGDEALSILAPAEEWFADRRSVHAGLVDPGYEWAIADYGRLQWTHECSWRTVGRWLRGFSQAERDELAKLKRAYYAWNGEEDSPGRQHARLTGVRSIVEPHVTLAEPPALFGAAS